MTLKVDPKRRHADCGIYVRALGVDGKCGSHDIADLTRDSLLEWLRSKPDRAEQTVLVLFGHPAESAATRNTQCPRCDECTSGAGHAGACQVPPRN
jgi:hypothetical protein